MWCEEIHKVGQTLRKKICAAFFSEDYEEELVERVRKRAFPYMYHSLCLTWRPDIDEPSIFKCFRKALMLVWQVTFLA